MKKRLVIASALLVFLTTITTKQKIVFTKFNLSKINVENNYLLKEKDIKNLLAPIYNRNLIFIKNKNIEKLLMQNSLIESFNIKKKYPNTLKVQIYEKKPIAIIHNKNKKYYLSEKIELIDFQNFPNYENLPFVIGNKNEFNILYKNLVQINFPLNLIKKYILYESNRWDLETVDDNILKLPSKNYIKSLENYLKLKNENEFKKYKVFDYRIKDQLILK